MARYKLLAAAVIDGALLEAGTEIEFDGIPGKHMLSLDKKGKEVPAPAPLDPAYLAYRHDRSIPGDPGVFTGFYGFAAGEAPTNVDVPYVSGTGAVGEELNCTMGNWTGEPTSYAYQWMGNGITVSTDGPQYVIVAGDAGHDMTCMVTATNDWGSTQAPPSNAVAAAAAEGATRRTGGDRGKV